MQDEVADNLAAAYRQDFNAETHDQADHNSNVNTAEASFMETEQQDCAEAQISQSFTENETFEDKEVYPYPSHVHFTRVCTHASM